MHSKQTVRYLCQKYPSGNEYFYKEEIITHDTWDNLDSLEWGRRRPVSKATVEKRKKEGYRVITTEVRKPKGKLFYFPAANLSQKEDRR
ncbi:hypothetical protein EBO34_03455 [Alteribacter keqinensis]|uniref:Uncharacterized protein n=1 Tax=Alteribacter keqinensis TaxID=2483800 RepID=A0A3M7TX82_9BACI|nr:hypothetical protein EBO34_03455 [Alteribacter keqinensis]